MKKKTNADQIQNKECYDKIIIKTKMNLPAIISNDYCFHKHSKKYINVGLLKKRLHCSDDTNLDQDLQSS